MFLLAQKKRMFEAFFFPLMESDSIVTLDRQLSFILMMTSTVKIIGYLGHSYAHRSTGWPLKQLF